MKTAMLLKIVMLTAFPLQAQNAVTANNNANSDLEPTLTRLTPHPYLFLGPSLMGGGYALLAYRVETGLKVESSNWVMKASAAYDNGRKVNDDDQPNPNGHDRYLESGIYFRPTWQALASDWFFGGGWSWNQLSTTNYTKSGTRPRIGGGYDLVLRSCSICRRDFSMRIAMDWVMAGTDWQNGSHGPDIVISMPGPRETRHWFWQEEIGIYRFHETVTEPANLTLTNQQQADRNVDFFSNMGVVYRF